MPRSTASISYSFAWVGILALVPVGRGFDLFRAASHNPTAESDASVVGRRLAGSSCDVGCDSSCDHGCDYVVTSCDDSCDGSCDEKCDEGCPRCADISKVGPPVTECNSENSVDGGAPTLGQCCECNVLYVRNDAPDTI